MEENVRLGRIAGVAVGVNWSVLVVLWLIAWSLAGERLPDTHPGHTDAAYWLVGTATAVVFLASLLAHELAHSLIARRHGVGVDRITLWLFGGVAMLRGEASTPSAEMRIAGIGPVVSLSLAAAFALTGLVFDRLGAPDLLGGAAGWLAFINLVLAVFNMIPAAPLDGGRVLRALLWRHHGDRLRATVQAAGAGRTFGYVLIGLGLVDFAAGATVGGLWFVFLGWFLLNAARAEASQALMRDALAGVTVGNVMTPEPITAPDHLSVDVFLDDYLMRHRASAFPIVDPSGHLIGLVTLARLKQVPREQRPTTLVRDVACPLADVPSAAPDEPLMGLLERMAGRTDGRALVFVDGRLVGIITPTDVARSLEIAAVRRG